MNNNDDLISREDAIGIFKVLPPWKEYSMDRIVNELKCLRSAKVEIVKYGRWLYEDFDPVMMPCSKCRYRVYRYNNTPYCPQCSAKMCLEGVDA